MSDDADPLDSTPATCPCCGYTAPIGRYYDRDPRGCPDCGASLAELRAAAEEVLEA